MSRDACGEGHSPARPVFVEMEVKLDLFFSLCLNHYLKYNWEEAKTGISDFGGFMVSLNVSGSLLLHLDFRLVTLPIERHHFLLISLKSIPDDFEAGIDKQQNGEYNQCQKICKMFLNVSEGRVAMMRGLCLFR